MKRPRLAFVLTAIFVFSVSFDEVCSQLDAQENTVADSSLKLGELTFPTSGSRAAQQKFLIAVKLLHNFEYEEAAEEFRHCQKIDANFGMAYWGQAMCYNHPLWGEQDLEKAHDVRRRWDNVAVTLKASTHPAFGQCESSKLNLKP